jgi:ferrous iron transport protein B
MTAIKTEKTIALVGNPNSGKSSLFNVLTGLRQQTSNFPGITVEKKKGTIIFENNEQLTLIDLPGCYSLYPNSSDERIVVNILADSNNENYPDLVLYVADINNLERHLLLATQIHDLQIPMILALNMADTVENAEKEINAKILAEKFSSEAILISSKTGFNVDQLKNALLDKINEPKSVYNPFYEIPDTELNLIESLKSSLKGENQYQKKLILHHFSWLNNVNETEKQTIQNVLTSSGFQNINSQIAETMSRFSTLQPLLKKVLPSHRHVQGIGITDKIDNWVTNRFIGPLFFLVVMFLIFQSMYSWSEKPMEWIENAFTWMGSYTKYVLGQGWLADLITDGILAGLSGVLVFIPQITILFFLIAVLEESGYMSRAVFMFDGILRKFGMNGRSIVALVSSGACAVPAIMSTRTIGSWKERIITILVAPLVSCSARLPVYALLVGFVVPDTKIWGVFNAPGLVFMGLYLMGIVMVFIVGFILNKVVTSEYKSHLLIELPLYKPPVWKNIVYTVKEKVWAFVSNAGKIIIIISILLWFLASFGPGDRISVAEENALSQARSMSLDREAADNLVAAARLENSFAGIFGKAIEPAIRPLGFDWKIGIALITSFAAREVFVGTMATIYTIGSTDDESTIREKMAAEIRPGTSEPMYNPVTSFSLLIFYVFAMQCMSTLAVTKKETNSWKWTMVQLLYLTGLAYFGSLIFYQIFA